MKMLESLKDGCEFLHSYPAHTHHGAYFNNGQLQLSERSHQASELDTSLTHEKVPCSSKILLNYENSNKKIQSRGSKRERKACWTTVLQLSFELAEKIFPKSNKNGFRWIPSKNRGKGILSWFFNLFGCRKIFKLQMIRNKKCFRKQLIFCIVFVTFYQNR